MMSGGAERAQDVRKWHRDREPLKTKRRLRLLGAVSNLAQTVITAEEMRLQQELVATIMLLLMLCKAILIAETVQSLRLSPGFAFL